MSNGQVIRGTWICPSMIREEMPWWAGLVSKNISFTKSTDHIWEVHHRKVVRKRFYWRWLINSWEIWGLKWKQEMLISILCSFRVILTRIPLSDEPNISILIFKPLIILSLFFHPYPNKILHFINGKRCPNWQEWHYFI